MFERKRSVDMPAFGDAHPARPSEVKNAELVGPKGIRLGYYRPPGHRKGWGDVIRYNGDGGLMLIAPPRMGKARDIQVGVLLDYDQSAIVIDPKGQLASITKSQRERMGHRCIVLNPFNVCSEVLGPSARYNPMTLLDPSAHDLAADCRKLAEGIIASTNDKDGMHFVGGGRGLLAGVIGGLVAHGSNDTKNLAYVREIVSRDDLLLKYARASLKSPHAFIRQELSTYAVAEPPNPAEVGAFKQTVREQTFFLGMNTIADNVCESDFRFADLKEGPVPTTVYVILPDNRLDVCGRWFRLIVASALDDLWRGGRGKHRVLTMLDEMAVIGRLDVLVNASATAAGRGIQLFPVLQNIPQLQRDYNEVWETFLSGSDIRMFFAPRENTTAEYISKMSGQRTITTAGESINNNGLLGKSNESDSSGQTGQPLIRPHEVSGLGRNEFLMFGPEGIVIDALRRPYFHTPEFEGMYDPDPMHENDAAPPPPVNPDMIVTFADSLAAGEEQATHARRARRPLALRVLTWGNGPNRFLDLVVKIGYFLTLPLRLLFALLLAPFAIHNRPLGAAVSFLALFGFWEVWNGIAKQPFVSFYESQRLNCAMRKSRELGIGGTDGHPFACGVEALKLTTGFFWKRVFVSLVTRGPERTANDFDVAYQKARFADRAGMPSPPEAAAPETSLDKEARNKAAAFWNTLVTTCGNSSYLVERGYWGITLVTEMKGAVDFSLQPEELGRTDELNRIEWRGHSIMAGPPLSRMRNFNEVPDEGGSSRHDPTNAILTLGEWGNWRDSTPHELSLALEKRSGKWSFHLMGDSLETDRYVRKRLSCPAMTSPEKGRVTPEGDLVSGEPIFLDVPTLLADERVSWKTIPPGETFGPAMSVQAIIRFDELENPTEAIGRLENGVAVFADYDGRDFPQKANYVLVKRGLPLDQQQEIRQFLKGGKPLEAAWVYQKPIYSVVRANDGRVGLILQEDFVGHTRPAPHYLP